MSAADEPEITTRGGASWRWALAGLGIVALIVSAAAAAWKYGLLAAPGVVIARDAHLIGDVFEIGAGFDARIERLEAEPGMQVTAGQILVELEDEVLRAEVAARRAELALAGGRRATAARALERDRALRDLAVEQARANVALVEAEQRSAAATAERRAAEFARISSLYDDNAVSQARRDEALAARDSAVAALHERDAALTAARSSLAEAKAERSGLDVRRLELKELDHRIEMARAELARAFADLDRATLEAPVAGWIVEVLARAGDSVRPGDAILSLWPETAIHLRAWVSEEDAVGVEPGQPVEMTFDAFSSETIAGTVEAVLIAPDGGPRRPPGTPVSPLLPDRTRFVVRIRLDEESADRRLLPGLSATARIDTRSQCRTPDIASNLMRLNRLKNEL